MLISRIPPKLMTNIILKRRTLLPSRSTRTTIANYHNHNLSEFHNGPHIPLQSSSSCPPDKIKTPTLADSSATVPVSELDLSFNDGKQAFRSKTTWEILRAYIVFKLCSFSFIVDNSGKLSSVGQKILGKKIFEKVMKLTFYGHFVAGKDKEDIKPKIDRLKDFGVKSILDYSAEEDVPSEKVEEAEMNATKPMGEEQPNEKFTRKYRMYKEFADRRKKANARAFFYLNEGQCEKNMEIFLQSIEAVSEATHGTGFAAIKITALGRPQLLMQLSEAIAKIHRYVGAVTGKRGRTSEQGVKLENFKLLLDKTAALKDPAVKAWLDGMTADSKGVIHIVPWKRIIEAQNQKELSESLKVVDLKTGELQNLVPPFTDTEEEMFRNMMRRLHTIFNFAKILNVRVMVDAEQTYLQPAISRITMEMMKKYNTERAIVFNTYQCYLKKAFGYFSNDLDHAERLDFHFGAKLVRGAYMEQERARAIALDYKDPINPSYDSTNEMYHKCILEGMQRMKKMKGSQKEIKIYLMAATHNEDTVRFVIEKMKEFGIEREDRVISFGQLYGMCDQITFPLGQSGYSAYKYVPYGPVLEVLPYLSRRAQENKGLTGNTAKERKLLKQELLRRIRNFEIFYKPKGNLAGECKTCKSTFIIK